MLGSIICCVSYSEVLCRAASLYCSGEQYSGRNHHKCRLDHHWHRTHCFHHQAAFTNTHNWTFWPPAHKRCDTFLYCSSWCDWMGFISQTDNVSHSLTPCPVFQHPFARASVSSSTSHLRVHPGMWHTARQADTQTKWVWVLSVSWQLMLFFSPITFNTISIQIKQKKDFRYNLLWKKY